MSAYGIFATEFRDVELLCAALKELGFPDVEVHNEPQNLVGYHGDKRKQKAEVIVRRKHIGGASNDLGFAKGPDGRYQAIISDFDRGQFNETWMGRCKQEYKLAERTRACQRAGLVPAGRKVIQTEKGPRVQLSFFKR